MAVIFSGSKMTRRGGKKNSRASKTKSKKTSSQTQEVSQSFQEIQETQETSFVPQAEVFIDETGAHGMGAIFDED